MTAQVHLICGSTGAGKTTYALKLASDLGAIRFSLDEWMATLFWMDIPAEGASGWAFERLDRCTAQIWAMVVQLAAKGIPSVLDFGFVRRADRTAIAALAARGNLAITLHVLDVPAEIRWQRVQARNAGQGETYRFAIPRERFDDTERLWEPPGDSELAALNGTRIV